MLQMANAWLRLYSEFSVDPKVQMMSEADQRRLIMLMCLRCNGHVTLQDKEVTFLLRISNESWQDTKQEFIENCFINSSNELINWDKRQFLSDSSAVRVAEHRKRKKEECNKVKRYSNALDTDTDTDTEKNKDMSFLQNDRTVVENVQTEVGSVVEAKRPNSKKLEVVEIFDYWKTVMNHTAAKLDAKREKAIGDALKIGYSTEQLKAAVMGCSVTPFNCGENDRNTRFDSVGIIFKSADQIDRFIESSINPGKSRNLNIDSGERKYKVLN